MSPPPLDGCPCTRDGGRMCDECVIQHVKWHGGIAIGRGESWARAISNVIPVDRPWPMTARMRAIARRKVDGLSKDERVLELLTEECVIGAATWWHRELARRRMRSG